ncbi:hypothetical protein H2198_008340 [Neophaeococcomyces mojaviensis]|uniref:Uncharacterized protein n=1 Tax=Neophaeococcomyces mojaviensis TaxID=3383035 RepID=A0ACC2ZXQ6_9EURO|nr:hypothetical protein H2198_008340 [Knufia sp. JES_112]
MALSSVTSTDTVRDEKPAIPVVHDGLKLLDLPLEIILAIEFYLAYENAIAFSLTCKYTYDLIFHQHKPTPKHHGREAQLLRLIERDLPAYLSCPIHERLYAWAPQKPKHYHCPLCISSRRTAWSDSLVICNKSCKSSFYGIFEPERRLMLRHTLLDTQYGISSRLLDHVCKKSHSKRANQVTPKIINDNLMLWRTHHVTARIDFKAWEDVSAFINNFNEAICLHSEIYLRPLLFTAIRYAKQRRDAMIDSTVPKTQPRAPTDKHWTCPVLFKCHMCATDFRLRMDQVSANEIIVQFDAYQDLGGLGELSIAQRQIFGVRHEGRHVVLKDSLKRERLVENLEDKYHRNEHDRAEDVANQRIDCATTPAPIPRYAAFLNHWIYYLRKQGEDRVKYFLDDMIPAEFQDEYSSIPFVPQKTERLEFKR